VDRARKVHFSTTGVRYILLTAVPAHARGGLPPTLETPPVATPRRSPRCTPGTGSAALAEDVAVVAVRAEEEESTARRNRTLNLSNRIHAVAATAGNWITRAGPCDSFRTSHAVATMGSELQLRALLFAVAEIVVCATLRRPTTRRAQIPAISRARRQSKLPADAQGQGALTIHHSAMSFVPNAPFNSAVTWDVLVNSAIQSYDVNGMPVASSW
jgi:hypothetical protein